MAAAKKAVLKVKIKHTGRFPLPAYATDGSAAMDLHAEVGRSTHIVQGHAEMIPTGIALQLPRGHVAKIYARSGIADKKGLSPSNCVGLVDSDYTGQIYVSLMNHSQVTQYIEPGERIAQLLIEKIEIVEWEEVDELTETARGIGGFGSTGEAA